MDALETLFWVAWFMGWFGFGIAGAATLDALRISFTGR